MRILNKINVDQLCDQWKICPNFTRMCNEVVNNETLERTYNIFCWYQNICPNKKDGGKMEVRKMNEVKCNMKQYCKDCELWEPTFESVESLVGGVRETHTDVICIHRGVCDHIEKKLVDEMVRYHGTFNPKGCGSMDNACKSSCQGDKKCGKCESKPVSKMKKEEKPDLMILGLDLFTHPFSR